MGSRRRLVGLVALVVWGAAVLTSRSASASEPPAAEKETARTLMDEGRDRAEKGDHKGALTSFTAADAIMHVPTTGLDVARQQVALGLLVEARDTISRMRRLPVGANEPRVFATAREAAMALDESLESRIPVIRVSVDGVSDLSTAKITLDGVVIPALALATLRVNPGHHVVSVLLQGAMAPAEGATDVAEGSEARLALTVTPVVHALADEDAEPAPVADDGRATTRAWLRWGGAGLGGAGVVVGAVTGIVSLSLAHDVKSACVANRCPPSSWSDLSSSRTTATISDVAFVAAGVGAVAFVTSFLLPAKPAATSVGRAHVTPWIAPTSAGIFATF